MNREQFERLLVGIAVCMVFCSIVWFAARSADAVQAGGALLVIVGVVALARWKDRWDRGETRPRRSRSRRDERWS